MSTGGGTSDARFFRDVCPVVEFGLVGETMHQADERVPLADIPPGTYVCAKTDQGRISQFRINGFAGTTMKLGYTTWAN